MWAVTRQVFAAQWNGSNGADLVAMCNTTTLGNTWTLERETPGVVLQLRETGPGNRGGVYSVFPDQVLVVAPDFGILDRMPMEAFQGRYRIVAETFEAALQASPTVDAMELAIAAAQSAAAGAGYGGFGVAALPTLLPGATSSPLAVTIEPEQPGTGYVARAFAVSGVAVLTTLQIMSRTNTNKSVCTIVVKNNGVASVGGLLLVHVTAPAAAAAK